MAYRFRTGEQVLSREPNKHGRVEWAWVTVVARHRDSTYTLEREGQPIKRAEAGLRLQCQLAI